MKNIFGFMIIILLFIGCQQETLSGVIGQQFLLKADLPDEVGTFDYIWKFNDLPESSSLTLADLEFTEDESQAIFVPDVAGIYSIQSTVWKYNDKLGAVVYNYEISNTIPELAAKQVSTDEWLNEMVEENSSEFENNVIENETNFDDDKADNMTAAEEHVILAETPVVSIQDKTPKKLVIAPISPASTIIDAKYTIQVAAESRLETANLLVNRLNTAGFETYIKEHITSSNQTVYRVRVGKFVTRDDATIVANVLKTEHNFSTWITSYQK